MSNEKDIIEYALHAYDTFWDYYKKTLEERDHILNNYMIFVGIPLSLVGVFVEKIKDNFENYKFLFILFFSIILILGFVIYSAYIIESLVSHRYLRRINHITKYLINNFDKNYQNVFKEAYELRGLFLDDNNSIKQRINKSFIIIIVNTIIIGVFLLLFDYTKWYHILLAIVISIIIHAGIFIYYNQKIKHS